MRKLIFALAVIIWLGVASPAEAQYRRDAAVEQAPVKVYDDERSSFSLFNLFSPEHFRLSHSYEMSTTSFGGRGLTMGTYTSSLMWQFNQKLAARVDVGFSHTPFGTGDFQQAFGGRESHGNIYIRNAELAYRPSENTRLHLSFRQSPYGSYMSPYGYYDRYDRGYYGRPYYGGSGFGMSIRAGGSDDLFWNPHLR